MSFVSFRWWEPANEDDPISNTDEAIALAYARNIPTLKYVEIFKCCKGSRRTWWRVAREKSGTSGQNDVSESIGAKEIDEEDGENAREFFDWNW